MQGWARRQVFTVSLVATIACCIALLEWVGVLP